MDSVFIEDGMTRSGSVKAVKGLHGALKFRFRPALAETRFAYVNRTNDDNVADHLCELLAKHVTEWDAKGKHGPAPISAETCKRLHPNVLVQMQDLVLGYAATDEQEKAEKN